MAQPQIQVDSQSLADATADFNTHYSLASGGALTPTSLTICWPDFQTAIEINGGISPITEIALKFLHRFDGTNWFLTMEVDQMDLTTGKIIATGNRFDIINNNITSSSFQGNFDPAYFANVLYDGHPMDPAIYVNSVVFPYYQQVSEIHCQNNLPDGDTSVSIVFESCSFDYSSSMPGSSLVPFPHCICIYMRADSHGDYVDCADYTQMFTNRGGDYSTLCPPTCNCYDWNSGCPPVATCRVSTKRKP